MAIKANRPGGGGPGPLTRLAAARLTHLVGADDTLPAAPGGAQPGQVQASAPEPEPAPVQEPTGPVYHEGMTRDEKRLETQRYNREMRQRAKNAEMDARRKKQDPTGDMPASRAASLSRSAQRQGLVKPVSAPLSPDTRLIGTAHIETARMFGTTPEDAAQAAALDERRRGSLEALMRNGNSGGSETHVRIPTAPAVPNRFGAAGASPVRVWNAQNIEEAPASVQASIRGMQDQTMQSLRDAVQVTGEPVQVDTTHWTPAMRQQAVDLYRHYPRFAPSRQATANARAEEEARAAEEANKASEYRLNATIEADRKARLAKHLTGQRKVIKAGEGEIDTTHWTPKMRQDLVDKWQAAGRKAERARKAAANPPKASKKQSGGVNKNMQKFADHFDPTKVTPKSKKK